MDEIEEVVLTLTPYEASVLRLLLTYAGYGRLKDERLPADHAVIGIDKALGDVGVPIATYAQCKSGNLDSARPSFGAKQN